MNQPPPGFRLIWDATSFDGSWVLLPGCIALLFVALLVVNGRRAVAILLALGAVWWTLGGIGAWRAGAGRLATGTADFVEGTVAAPVPGTGGRLDRFQVGGLQFRRARDAVFPALHAARWPPLTLAEGTPVRLWFFEDDLLRIEVGASR